MRSLVLAFALGGLLFLSQKTFAQLNPGDLNNRAGCPTPSATGSEDPLSYAARCSAVAREARVLRNYSSLPANQTELDQKITALENRAKCCTVGGTDCERVGRAPGGAANTGAPAVKCASAAVEQFYGENAAHGAGVCNASKIICDDYVARASASGAASAGLNYGRANTVCSNINPGGQVGEASSRYANFRTETAAAVNAAGPGFVCPTPGPGAGPGGGGGNGPGGGGGGQAGDGSATPDSNRKSPSSGNPFGQLAQMAGPIAQQFLQQQEEGEQPKPPELAQVQCGPGVIHPSCKNEAQEQKEQPWNTGKGEFQTASKNSNFGNSDGGVTPGTNKPTYTASNDQQQKQDGQAAVVPQGGGGMPGGAGGNAAASAGGGGGGGGYQTASTKLPDANSLTSHGSSMANLNQSLNTAAGGGGGGYTAQSTRPGLGDEPMNYADFLPKPGSTGRALAGANLRPIPQIQSKEVNIWNRISDHFKQRCSLGLLRDCIP